MGLGLKVCSMLLVIGLAGCGPQTPYERYQAGEPLRGLPYKAGGTPATAVRDLTDCEVIAARQVPQQIVVSTTPTYTTPVQTSCNQIGSQTFCNSTGGQTYGGQTRSSDANAGLRQRVFNQCVADKQYRYVDIPACPSGVSISVASEVFPPLTPKTCYLVTPQGEYKMGTY